MWVVGSSLCGAATPRATLARGSDSGHTRKMSAFTFRGLNIVESPIGSDVGPKRREVASHSFEGSATFTG